MRTMPVCSAVSNGEHFTFAFYTLTSASASPLSSLSSLCHGTETQIYRVGGDITRKHPPSSPRPPSSMPPPFLTTSTLPPPCTPPPHTLQPPPHPPPPAPPLPLLDKEPSLYDPYCRIEEILSGCIDCCTQPDRNPDRKCSSPLQTSCGRTGQEEVKYVSPWLGIRAWTTSWFGPFFFFSFLSLFFVFITLLGKL